MLSLVKDDFALLEAILWEPDRGYFLLDFHLDRLSRSARFFERALDVDDVRMRLERAAMDFGPKTRKVRLEFDPNGVLRIEALSIEMSDTIVYAVSTDPVQSSDVFLQHKTSERAVYDQAMARYSEAADVVLWNERGELTESCHSNLVLDIGGQKLTPRQDCGLLPGTFRAFLLEQGEIAEAVLPLAALEEADDVFLINSVRLWRRGIRFEEG